MNLVGMPENRMFALAVAALCSLVACGPARQVSESGFGAYEVSLAAWSDGLALAWYDTRHGNAELYVRPLDAMGRAAGPELRVTATPAQSYEADIAPFADAFAIAWYEESADGALSAQLGVWSRDGTQRWTTSVAVGTGHSRNAIVRNFGDALFCAWIEADADGNEGVWGGWWELDGKVRAAPELLGAAGANTWNLNAAVAESGAALVVFDAQAGTRAEELFVATLADGRASLVQLSADDGVASKYPDIALAGADAALTWYDERAARVEREPDGLVGAGDQAVARRFCARLGRSCAERGRRARRRDARGGLVHDRPLTGDVAG